MAKLTSALIRRLISLPKPSRIMVIGEIDTGKSSLVKLLAQWFYNKNINVAIVNADVGQSHIGPPGFVSYGIVNRGSTSPFLTKRKGSYLVGKTSPYNKELVVSLGAQQCIRAACVDGAEVILIDTSGLVAGAAGLRLKCAKAVAVKPDLIIVLSTPAVEFLSNYLGSLGFVLAKFLPLREVQNKSTKERMRNRISWWNSYIGENPHISKVDLSKVRIYRWWGENRYANDDEILHGTVAAMADQAKPYLQLPCIWLSSGSGSNPSILLPFAQDYLPKTIWISSYKLGLSGTEIVSA